MDQTICFLTKATPMIKQKGKIRVELDSPISDKLVAVMPECKTVKQFCKENKNKRVWRWTDEKRNVLAIQTTDNLFYPTSKVWKGKRKDYSPMSWESFWALAAS